MPRRSLVLLAAAMMLPLSTITVHSAATAASSGSATPAGTATEARVSSVALDDPTGDVWAIGDGEDSSWVSAGDVPTADVVHAVASHGRARVRVEMTFTDLRREEPQSYVAMLTTGRRLRAVFVSAGPGRWTGRRQMVNGQFATVRCPRLTHSIDYDTEQVVISVPRSCLGLPRFVRVGMSNMMFRGETEADFQEITDNPHTADAEGSQTQRLYRAAG
jgi:hypothetical protein